MVWFNGGVVFDDVLCMCYGVLFDVVCDGVCDYWVDLLLGVFVLIVVFD